MLDREIGMLVTSAVRRRTVRDDVLVRRYCEPDVDLEAGSVPMFAAWGDHRDATSRDAMIVRFEAFDFSKYLRASGI
jgi:hypothetical protein